MSHWNIQFPSFQTTPEERENGRDLVLKPDDALPLYNAFGFSRATLPVDSGGSGAPEFVAGDALLTE